MQFPALIRTYVPVGVGYVITFLATLGVRVDGTAQTALVLGLGGVTSAVYYTGAHALESRWPVFSVLLGSSVTPSYHNAKDSSGSSSATATSGSPEYRG
ncbi:hypothetical protein ACFZAM_31195 [Streptomyces sp. NPDC008079]|uniref:hypothetical protein n=1 Tax=Streptomyces sp. NPDC008079 TaxID=3364806 RepID=UPI0036E4068C